MPFEVERPVERFDDAVGELACHVRVGHAEMDHRELVAAEPSDDVAFRGERAQAVGAILEDAIAARVAERVVDFLEAVEVDCQDGEAAAVLTGKGLGQAIGKSDAVRQAGQRVVSREESDLVDRSASLGDVLVSPQPAARRHRPHADLDDPSIEQFDLELAARLDGALDQAIVRFGRIVERAGGHQRIANVGIRSPGHEQMRRNAVQFGVVAIERDQAPIPVEHRQSVDHVLERRAAQLGLAPQLNRERLAFGRAAQYLVGERRAVLGFRELHAGELALEREHAETRKQDQRYRGSNGDGERGAVDRGRRHRHGGTRVNRNRRHGDEVEAADRQGEEERGEPCEPRRSEARHPYGSGSEGDPENHRDADEHPVPFHEAGHLDCRHADVVHRGDAGSDDCAAEHRPSRSLIQCDDPADPSDHHRGGNRNQGGREVVSHRDFRLVGEHGDEMRGPDPEPGDDRGQSCPGNPARVVAPSLVEG